ncbi:hypothetical protein [Saccharothrix lopnurensis]|uniref:Uncharacterized protein n=1 Tax=Saccharothrix lopnurensis TaxID=1670621 RepID=A0ABW1PDM2_9PSEU
MTRPVTALERYRVQATDDAGLTRTGQTSGGAARSRPARVERAVAPARCRHSEMGGRPTTPAALGISRPILRRPRWRALLATAPALMMIIGNRQRAKNQISYVPSGERDLYGLPPDAEPRGRNDLERRGLLEVKRVPQGGEFDYHRMRALHRVHLKRFGDPSPAELLP